jgi:FkbM family methyltransferase
MRKYLKQISQKFPGLLQIYRGLHRWAFYTRHNVRDVFDNHLAPPLKPEACSLGFVFGGLRSPHHRAMQKGVFEPDEVRWFSQTMPKFDVFIDVGANVGYFSCLAKHLGLYTIAIEPMSRNLRCLLQNFVLNGWKDVEVVAAGVSNKIGSATLFGASSTGASLINRWAGSFPTFGRSIPLTTLDTILGDRFSDKQILIKMDIEGFEYPALLGAERLLSRALKPTWLIEITYNQYHPSGCNPHFEETFSLFWKHGYSTRLMEPKGLRPINAADIGQWKKAGSINSQAINFIFSPLNPNSAG